MAPKNGPVNFGGLGPGKPQPATPAVKQKPTPKKGPGLSLKNNPTIAKKI